MANILILSLVFAPDGVSTSVIVSELAEELAQKGHRVTVLTTQPHYNFDPEARAKQPLARRWGGLFYRSDYCGIPIWHTAMRPKGKRILGRIVDYLVFHIISMILGFFAIGRQNVVFAVSPPLTIGLVGWILSVFKRAKLVYNVQELYPDTAITMGVLKENSFIARVLKWVELFIYRRSAALTVICQPFADVIAAKGIAPNKIHVIPNFVDTEFVQPGPKNNSLARELGLYEKYVVLYAGNIGMTQSFDTLMEVANRLQDETRIVFLIVGDGARRSHVEARVREQHLNNVKVLAYQPRSRVPDIYAMSDLCLVPLMTGTAKTTIPSKLYTIMASGRPALVAVDEESDLVQTVKDAQSGIAVKPDDIDALLQGIQQAFENQQKFAELGQNGRWYVERYLSRQAVSAQYHKLIQEIMGVYE
ncbi:MAG TPA: glycosyltransferase family 4 protein [Aggregatilineaceae bacterium]|nr:glycosyltransferase family 4 protein [Aggregatilineaceae bacterium]